MDRPAPDVILAVQKLVDSSNNKVNFYAAPAPGRVIDKDGEHWMTVLVQQYKQLRKLAPDIDAASLWEDDAILSKEAFAEYRAFCRCLEYDRIEIESVFYWDKPTHINVAFPRHWSALLFRCYPDDEYPTDFVVHCPERVARSPHFARFQGVWHNFGYMDKTDRELTFQAQKAAGKVDPHSTCLVSAPTLKKVRHNGR
jgi:hypothetical protein